MCVYVVCFSCRGNAHYTNCIVLVIAEFCREKNDCFFILKLVCDQLGIKTMQLTLGTLYLSQNIHCKYLLHFWYFLRRSTCMTVHCLFFTLPSSLCFLDDELLLVNFSMERYVVSERTTQTLSLIRSNRLDEDINLQLRGCSNTVLPGMLYMHTRRMCSVVL